MGLRVEDLEEGVTQCPQDRASPQSERVSGGPLLVLVRVHKSTLVVEETMGGPFHKRIL